LKHFLRIFVVLGFVSCSSYSKSIEIEGVVKLKGSEPHTFIVIEDAKSLKDYKITNSKKFNLFSKQNSRVKIRANIVKKALGAGFPASVEVIEVLK